MVRLLNYVGRANVGNPRVISLINLQSQFADFATAFHEVIDFVPIDEQLKQLALRTI